MALCAAACEAQVRGDQAAINASVGDSGGGEAHSVRVLVYDWRMDQGGGWYLRAAGWHDERRREDGAIEERASTGDI